MTLPPNITQTSIVVGARGIHFVVYHNLPDVTGMSISDAFTNWLARTGTFTAKSFIQYVESKQTGVFIKTEADFNKLCKKHNIDQTAYFSRTKIS